MADDTEESMRRLKEAMEVLTGAYADETAAMRAKRQADEEAVAKKKKNDNALAAAGATAQAALGRFGKSLLSTEAGMAKYNAGLSSAGTAAFDIGKNFGILGMAVGGLVKLFTMGIELVNKQNDAMIKAYDTLSEFGQTAKFTTMDILALGRASGFTSHNLEIFTKNASSVSQELAGLTGSASDGLKAFGKLTSVTQEQRNQYNRLGLSQERVLEMQALSVKQSVAGGITLTKNADEQRKASLAYIDAQLELAALTGIDVKKQQQLQDAVNSDLNFQQYKYNQNRKAQELTAQAEKQDSSEEGKLRKAKLLSDAESIQIDIEKRNQLAKLAKESFGDERATGMLQALATKNMNVITSQTAGMAAVGWDFQKILRDMNKGGSGQIVMLGENVKAVKWFSKTLGDVAAMTGDGGKAMMGAFSQSTKDVAAATEWDKFATTEDQIAWEAKRKLLIEEMADKKAGLGMRDIIKQTQNEQLTVELRARQALDDLAIGIRGPTTAAFRGLISVMNSFGRAVGKIISIVMPETGKKIQDQFADPEELQQQKTEIVAKREILDKEIAVRTAEVNKYEAANKELDIARNERQTTEEAFNKLNSGGKPKDMTQADWETTKIAAYKAKEAARSKHDNALHKVQQAHSEAGGDIGITTNRSRIAERKSLDDKLADIDKNLARINGKEWKEEEKVRTVAEDPRMKEAEQELTDKINLTNDLAKKEKAALFKKETGLDWSEEEEKKHFKTTEAIKIFNDRADAQSQKLVEKVRELEERNNKLKLTIQQEINDEVVKQAREREEKRREERGQEQGPGNSANGSRNSVEIKNAAGEVTETRTGGNINWRNNNPGNIRPGKFATSMGAIGENGGFAVFPSEDIGRKAADSLLKAEAYASLTAAAAIKKWAPAADNNDPVKYAADISKKTGIDMNKKYVDMSPKEQSIFLDAMKGIEGGKEGTVVAGKTSTAPAVAAAPAKPVAPAQVEPQPSVAQSTLPNPVTDPKGYKAAVNARALRPTEAETPSAAFGGVLSGPTSGYPVTLHGREAVVPMPNPNSLIAEGESTKVQKDPLPTTTSASSAAANADNKVLLELFQMLSDKMDTLGDYMASGNDTREELLKYSRV